MLEAWGRRCVPSCRRAPLYLWNFKVVYPRRRMPCKVRGKKLRSTSCRERVEAHTVLNGQPHARANVRRFLPLPRSRHGKVVYVNTWSLAQSSLIQLNPPSGNDRPLSAQDQHSRRLLAIESQAGGWSR